MSNDPDLPDRYQWVAIELEFADNPKLLRVGALGGWVHLRAILYAARHRTNGFVPTEAIWKILHDDPDVDAEATLLEASMVQANLWHPVAGGYQIHDYLKHQSNAETIRDKRARAGRLGGLKSAEQRAKQDGKQTSSKGVASKLEVEVEAEKNPPKPPLPGGAPSRGSRRRTRGGTVPEPFSITKRWASYIDNVAYLQNADPLHNQYTLSDALEELAYWRTLPLATEDIADEDARAQWDEAHQSLADVPL